MKSKFLLGLTLLLSSVVGLASCTKNASSKTTTPTIEALTLEAGEVVFGLQTTYENVEYSYSEDDETKVIASQVIWEYVDGESETYTDVFYSLYGTSTKVGKFAPLIEKYSMVCLARPGEYTFGGSLPALGCTFGINVKGTEYLAMSFFAIDFSSMYAGTIAVNLEVELVDIQPVDAEQ